MICTLETEKRESRITIEQGGEALVSALTP